MNANITEGPGMNKPLDKISASFICKICGGQTEVVLFTPKDVSSIISTSCSITYNFGSETMAISDEEATRVRQALLTADAAALYTAHHRWLATYCPQCEACYCKNHWTIQYLPDPSSDSYSMHFDTYGTCPAGHRRLMAKDSLSWPEEK
jgi:hypothetical protein